MTGVAVTHSHFSVFPHLNRLDEKGHPGGAIVSTGDGKFTTVNPEANFSSKKVRVLQDGMAKAYATYTQSVAKTLRGALTPRIDGKQMTEDASHTRRYNMKAREVARVWVELVTSNNRGGNVSEMASDQLKYVTPAQAGRLYDAHKYMTHLCQSHPTLDRVRALDLVTHILTSEDGGALAGYKFDSSHPDKYQEAARLMAADPHLEPAIACERALSPRAALPLASSPGALPEAPADGPPDPTRHVEMSEPLAHDSKQSEVSSTATMGKALPPKKGSSATPPVPSQPGATD